MTRQIKHFCDTCGKEIGKGEEISVEIGSMFGITRGKVYETGDLCDPCARKAIKFIFNFKKK